jgi:hypothetical protein
MCYVPCSPIGRNCCEVEIFLQRAAKTKDRYSYDNHPTTSQGKMKMSKAKDQCKIFHILECELWLQQNGQFTTAQPVVDGFEMYADLSVRFPPLPDRYSSLVLPDDWFLKKSAFKQIPDDAMASIRKRWKDIRGEIRLYASAVALIVMNRRREISRIRPTQVRARRASLLIDRYHPQEQPRRASIPATPLQLLPFQTNHQAQRESLPDMNFNQLSAHRQPIRLSSIVSSSHNFDLRDNAVIGRGFVNCQPAEQIDNFNPFEEPNIKVIWAQEIKSVRAWADNLMRMNDKEMLEYYRLMDLK